LRVSGTGVLAHYYGTRVADGFFHTFSGWVIYIAAAVLLFATGWVLIVLRDFGKMDKIYRRTRFQFILLSCKSRLILVE